MRVRTRSEPHPPALSLLLCGNGCHVDFSLKYLYVYIIHNKDAQREIDAMTQISYTTRIYKIKKASYIDNERAQKAHIVEAYIRARNVDGSH